MRVVDGKYPINEIPTDHVVFTVTSADQCCDMDRMYLIEHWPEHDYGDEQFLVLSGGHCSCYDFPQADWEATYYSREELEKVARAWAKSGIWTEEQMGRLIANYHGFGLHEEADE
jgi:hypothetical protein